MNPKPRWVLNATTLSMGGAIQACVNFMVEAAADDQIDWHFFLSDPVAGQLIGLRPEISLENLHIFSSSPARNRRLRAEIHHKVSELAPDLVFTFFGPAYIAFDCLHFLGFADGWVLYPNKYAVAALPSLSSKIEMYLTCLYKRYWLKTADFWVVETPAAQAGLIRITGASADSIAVVPNGCRDIFRSIRAKDIPPKDQPIRLLCISTYYPHKNFELVPAVAKALKQILPERSFVFILTLNEDDHPVKSIAETAVSLGVQDSINFVGTVALKDVPVLYEKSHIAFIPTLLETFSAAYSEAMASELPIVTSDFHFSRAVCKDGAFYFKPDDAEHAAGMIAECIVNTTARATIIEKAKIIADQLPDARKKYLCYKLFIEKSSVRKRALCAG